MEKWEEIENFVLDQVKGGKRVDTSKYEKVDGLGYKLMTKEGIESLASKIMELDILKSNFKVFEEMPLIWRGIYLKGMEIASR